MQAISALAFGGKRASKWRMQLRERDCAKEGDVMLMQKAIEEIDLAFEALKKEIASMIEEVRRILRSLKIQKQNPEDAHEKKAKPLWIYLRERPGYGTVAIVWTRVLYFNKERNLPQYRDIARGRGYRISQRRFMQYARGYHPAVQEELFEYEQTFGEFRRRQAFLSKARTCLLQFQKEMIKPVQGV
jgi:hypothetical protein